ncbi:hypothetical protein H0W91_01785 [Patescibacteria group bacterium]|nr:hypothetical protein [Patescibacteria group bacterium]
MKKYTTCLVSVLFMAGFFVATSVSAQAMMSNKYSNQQTGTTTNQVQSANITTALQDIYSSQGISSNNQIVCNKVTDVQFEKLGDAYMGLGITEEQHTAMENMMGGEGSATLTQAHINMGRAYIGCWANYSSGPSFRSMMGGSGSQTNQPYSYGGMMGRYYGDYGFFGLLHMILLAMLGILGIIVLIKWLNK